MRIKYITTREYIHKLGTPLNWGPGIRHQLDNSNCTKMGYNMLTQEILDEFLLEISGAYGRK